jgi:hypothetical protein
MNKPIKATIRRLTQKLGEGPMEGIYITELELITDEGQEMVFRPENYTLIDSAQHLQEWTAKDISQDIENGMNRRLAIVNHFNRAASEKMFIPQILMIAGAKSVDDLPGCQIICNSYNGMETPCVFEIASLDGTKTFSPGQTTDALSKTMHDIEKHYERRGATGLGYHP